MSDRPVFGAIVLAGGRSRRFGRDKASELLLGRPLLQHVIDLAAPLVDEFVVVRAPMQRLPAIETQLPMVVVDDDYPGSGPLGGIYTGLRASRAERCLALACDMPLLSHPLLAELLRRSAGYDVVIPVIEFPEPLHAVYARSCLEAMAARLDAGQLHAAGLLSDVRVCYVGRADCAAIDADLRSFINVNTEEELARVEALLSAPGGLSRSA